MHSGFMWLAIHTEHGRALTGTRRIHMLMKGPRWTMAPSITKKSPSEVAPAAICTHTYVQVARDGTQQQVSEQEKPSGHAQRKF